MQRNDKRSRLICGTVLATGAAFIFAAGFLISDQVLFPSATLLEAKTAIRSFVKPPTGVNANGNRIVWSIFLPFELEEIDVPVKRAGSGGGLTSIGDTLIVLTHEG